VNGETSLHAAWQQAETNRDAERARQEQAEAEAREEAEACDFLDKKAPDLAAQVGDGQPFQTYLEAWDVWNRRHREEAEAARRKKKAAAEQAAAEQKNAEQWAANFAIYLLDLTKLQHPHMRERARTDWHRGQKAVSSMQRPHVTPTTMRTVADGLHALAEEWEN
jgi:hypothetical protein